MDFLKVATAICKIIEPMLSEEVQQKIKKLLRRKPQQLLATMTFYMACKAQDELGWQLNTDALAKIIGLIRKQKKTFSWSQWEQVVLPVIFPEIALTDAILYSWRILVADKLSDDLKDKFLYENIVGLRKEHAEQNEILGEMNDGIKKLLAFHQAPPPLGSEQRALLPANDIPPEVPAKENLIRNSSSSRSESPPKKLL